MGFLCKDNNPVLTYNHALAEKNITALKKAIHHDRKLKIKYRNMIEKRMAKG